MKSQESHPAKSALKAYAENFGSTENKPPMFGTSATFDPATHEAQSGKSALMNELMTELAGKPEALLKTIIGNCTTTLPLAK